MKVAIYIRVSTDEQANEGFSIRAQRNLLVDYCRVNDYEVTNVYLDDGYSAKDTKRPQLQKLLEDAKTGEFKAVLVYKLDRFTRSVRDLYELLEYLQTCGVDFISKQEKFDTTTAIGRAMIGILGVFAQFERELIAERVRLGMEQKAREGKKPGGKYPYGYDKEGNQIPEEIESLRKVKSLYMSGMSYQAVAAKMLGIPRRDSEWTASNVALTLENPFYAGIIRFGSKLPNGKYAYRKRDLKVKVLDVQGSHEPAWSMEEYEELIARMRRRPSGGNSRIQTYWFNGVLKCGRCGSSMYGRMTNKRSRKDGSEVRQAYYWCSRRKANKGCDLPMFRQVHIEHLMMEHIESIKIDRARVEAEREKNKNVFEEQKKEIARLKREADKVKGRMKKWQYAFAEDIISAEDLKTRMGEEETALHEIDVKLKSYNDKDTSLIDDLLFELAELWPDMEDIDKQDALSTIFDTIVVKTDMSNVKGVKNAFFPAEIDVKYN